MGDTLTSIDPATGEELGRVDVADEGAVQAAVAAARAAQPRWASAGLDGRRDRLRQAAIALADRRDELAELLTREMGKPLREAQGEVAHCLDSMPELLDEQHAALAPDELADAHTLTRRYRDPFGVAAVITPWNFPLLMPHQLVLAALMAGNTVVLKPSEHTPLVAQAWARVLQAALPADTLRVVHGADATGRALVGAAVDLVAFTGSREVGQQILARAGGQLKRVVLELGGKDPLVVLDDADLDAAARFAARNAYRNAGQVCVSTERIYVAAPIADAFEQRFVEEARQLVVGAGLDPKTRVGPMIDERQKAHVLRQVDEAVAAGARLVLDQGRGDGRFLPPLALADVDHSMAIMRDETFGPVACLQRVRDDDEAVERANDTPFGLGAVVFGGDLDRAQAVARRLRAGMVGINRGVGGAKGAPWVGAQQSGYGFHSGPEGHRQFAQVRIVSLPR